MPDGVQSGHSELIRFDRRSISPLICEWVIFA